MKRKIDILVIGGSAAGLVAAMTAKTCNPEKSVAVIRKEEIVMIPCAIPYIFSTVGTSDRNVLPDKGLKDLGVDIIVDEVLSVDPKTKTCTARNGGEIQYDKLILGIGSVPAVPGWLKGAELGNVFTIPKDKKYLDSIKEKLQGLKRVVVVGAGFIGVEVSDELARDGKEVTLVEVLPNVLGATFDKEFAEEAEKLLTGRGITVKTICGIEELMGSQAVEKVKLKTGEIIETDAVILSLGYEPNTKLARDMGLALNKFGFICADQYRRTSIPDIYAVGDCAEKVDFSTGKLSKIMLASPACTEGRIAGMNLYELNTFGSFRGTIGIYATCIENTALCAAGLIEKQAREEGFDIVTATFSGVNRHPGNLSDAHAEIVKLIASKPSGVILGGEVMGGKDAGQLINVIGLAIQNHMTVFDLLLMQIGTQPLLTASPAAFPLIKAAEKAAALLK